MTPEPTTADAPPTSPSPSTSPTPDTTPDPAPDPTRGEDEFPAPDSRRDVQVWRSWMPGSEWLHLVYLANLLWQPIFNPGRTWLSWVIVVTVVVLYVPLYVAAHHPVTRVARRALWATIALGTAVTLVNVGGAVLFVYAAANAAWIDRRHLLRWQAGLTTWVGLLTLVSPIPMPYRVWGVLPSVAFIWLIGWMVRGEVLAHEAAERLRIDNVRIEQLATANERERIARDLHDLLGQSLTALVVKAQLVRSLLPDDPDGAVAHADDLEGSARDALHQVRAAIDGLGEVSLLDELDTARRTLAAADVALEVEIDRTSPGPGPLVERTLALALREATTNVVRHSGARSCRIELVRVTNEWCLEVADDGVGSHADEGNGLRGMRERIVAIGGSVRRDGSDGMRLAVRVPA